MGPLVLIPYTQTLRYLTRRYKNPFKFLLPYMPLRQRPSLVTEGVIEPPKPNFILVMAHVIFKSLIAQVT